MSVTTAEYYERFAEIEAKPVSPVYEAWARGVAADAEVLALIETLPRAKRQANLVFGSARFLGAVAGTYAEFRAWLLAHWSGVARVALERATQTNEPARCATLLPFLTEIDGPIALIEAGASAGLCLYPDRISYRFHTGDRVEALDPAEGESEVVLHCDLEGIEPPTRLPNVVWRAGIDLNPLDVTDADARAWLEALVWPGMDERRDRISKAASIVAADPPLLVRGDICEQLAELAAQAPAGAHLVVFHSAVLVYLAPEDREAFVRDVRNLPATWISNEGAGVLPVVQRQLSSAVNGRFVVSVDGIPRALAGPHGQSLASL